MKNYKQAGDQQSMIVSLQAPSAVSRIFKDYFTKNILFCKIIFTFLVYIGEGALFENAVFNQLREYGDLAYLSKGNEYEVDFVVTGENGQSVGLEVKYHPIESDDLKLKRIAQKNKLSQSWVVGRYPTPGFENFIWGG